MISRSDVQGLYTGAPGRREQELRSADMSISRSYDIGLRVAAEVQKAYKVFLGGALGSECSSPRLGRHQKKLRSQHLRHVPPRGTAIWLCCRGPGPSSLPATANLMPINNPKNFAWTETKTDRGREGGREGGCKIPLYNLDSESNLDMRSILNPLNHTQSTLYATRQLSSLA